MPTAYIDVSGRVEVRAGLREHLAGKLVHDAVVGITSQEQFATVGSTGPRPAFFFAPERTVNRLSATTGSEFRSGGSKLFSR